MYVVLEAFIDHLRHQRFDEARSLVGRLGVDFSAKANNISSDQAHDILVDSFEWGVEAVTLLLAIHADPCARDVLDRTLFHQLAGGGPDIKDGEAIIALLQQHGLDINEETSDGTPLLHTLRGRSYELHRGTNSQWNSDVREGYWEEVAAQGWSAEKAMRAFLKAGADVHRVSQNGLSALGLALLDHHLDLAEILLAHGADPNRPLPSGRALLQWIFETQSVRQSAFTLLVQHGADVTVTPEDAKNAVGRTLRSYDNLWEVAQRYGRTHYLTQVDVMRDETHERFSRDTAAFLQSEAFQGEKLAPSTWLMVAHGDLPELLQFEHWQQAPADALKLWNAVGPYYRQKHREIDLTYAYAAAADEAGRWQGVVVKSQQPESLTGNRR